MGADLDAAQVIVERVLPGDSIVDQVVRGDLRDPMMAVELATLSRRIEETTEAVRQIREIAATPWDALRSVPESRNQSIGVLVAEHCLAVLGDPDEWKASSGYDSLALCVLDSIWSIGIRYERVVVPLIDRYRTFRRDRGADPEVDSLEDLMGVIDSVGGPDGFAKDVVKNSNRTSSRSGVLKSQAVHDACEGLLAVGINQVDDLRGASDDLLDSARRAWTTVRGQRSGISWSYLLMLTGDEGVKPDRMIRRFVADALDRGPDESTTSASEAERGLRDALVELQKDYPSLTLLALDRTVWSFQSRTGPAPTR